MSKRQLIILFGALIILIALFSGFPTAWNQILNIIIGVLIIIVAYTTTKSSTSKRPSDIPYVDTHESAMHEAVHQVKPADMPEPTSDNVTKDNIAA